MSVCVCYVILCNILVHNIEMRAKLRYILVLPYFVLLCGFFHFMYSPTEDGQEPPPERLFTISGLVFEV